MYSTEYPQTKNLASPGSRPSTPLACPSHLKCNLRVVGLPSSDCLPEAHKTFLKLKKWPAGDFTMGIPPGQKSDNSPHPLSGITSDGGVVVMVPRTEVQKDHTRKIQALFSVANWFYEVNEPVRAFHIMGVIGGLLREGRHLDLTTPLISVNPDSFPLEVSGLEGSTPKRRARRGRHGITSYGKRMVRSGTYLLEKRSQEKTMAFLTTTLPVLFPDEYLLVLEKWSVIQNRFMKEICRELRRNGLSEDWVAVTEIQEKRYREYGNICPHLHIVFQGKKSRYCKQWAISKEWLNATWERVLSNILSREIEAPMSTRVECVRKSAVGYLGKYMSKGDCFLLEIIEENPDLPLPTAWYGCSDELKERVKEKSSTYREPWIELLMDDFEYYVEKGVVSGFRIHAKLTSRKTGAEFTKCIGVSGRFLVNNWQEILVRDYLLMRRKRSNPS